MTGRRRAWFWAIGFLLLAALVVTSMVLLTGYARSVASAMKRALAAPGPPITAANLRERLPGIPVKPGMVLDEAATNSPVTRLMVGLQAGGARKATIAVFETSESLNTLAPWYTQAMRGWHVRPLDRKHGEHESQVQGFSFRKEDYTLTLLELPQMKKRIVLVFTERVRPTANG
jgi:hypothetical protein